jgi:hypothetical protein
MSMVARASLESPSADSVIAETRGWIEDVVIGLDLCPFAGEPMRSGRVRFVVSSAAGPEELSRDLAEELARLDREPPEKIETTLVVHPRALRRFEDFNLFLDAVDLLLEKLSLVGTIQVASFHPDYCFAGVDPDDVANATNRSPYPMLHLLREESVGRATSAHPDPEGIPERNVQRLRALGWEGLARLTPRVRPPA